MKVLVTGANGQLGSELRLLVENGQLKGDFVFTTSKDLNLLDMPNVSDFIRYEGFDWILNFAAYTAVDKAEDQAQLAYALNSDAVFNIVQAAEWIGAKVIHISTDYVFDGKNYRPYREDDPINPQSIYGKSKAKGEEHVLKYFNGLVIRTSWLYSAYGHNFVKTMLKLANKQRKIKVVYDQIGTPTSAADLALAIAHIIRLTEQDKLAFKPGCYHFSNEGVASWYDFAKAVFETAKINVEIEPIPTEDFPAKAPRPPYSVLDKRLFKSVFNYKIMYWKDSLIKIIKDLNK